MLTIYFDSLSPKIPRVSLRPESEITFLDLLDILSKTTCVPSPDTYFTYNGKIVTKDAAFMEGDIHAHPRLIGGKGGFGSMLRAIGAQIEKTTNREACRDLSGRRLRDINEEKRLKSWINKKADRERETAERRLRKLEKLRSDPKHHFTDKKYEEERSKLTDEVSIAVEKGFNAVASNPGSSRISSASKAKKGFMLEDEEISSGSSISSSEDEVPSDSQQPTTGSKRKAESSDSEEESPVKKQCVSSTEDSGSDSDDSSSSSTSNSGSEESEQEGVEVQNKQIL